MGGASVLEMKNIGATLLVDDNARIIILAHDHLVLRLQLNVILRVQILLRMRTTLIRLPLMHQALTAALYIFSATFLQ